MSVDNETTRWEKLVSCCVSMCWTCTFYFVSFQTTVLLGGESNQCCLRSLLTKPGLAESVVVGNYHRRDLGLKHGSWDTFERCHGAVSYSITVWNCSLVLTSVRLIGDLETYTSVSNTLPIRRPDQKYCTSLGLSTFLSKKSYFILFYRF